LFGVGSAFGDEEDARVLLRQLTHADPAVRLASAEALMRYCKPDKFVLPELKKMVRDDQPEVRLAIKEAIAVFEETKKP
jgi:HEAT repeat protein